MTTYHESTLELLLESGIKPISAQNAALSDWAQQNGIDIPAAFMEWAQLDPNGAILTRFSNTDHFDWAKLGTLPDGRRGLFFHEESQGNFEAVCLLDHGDDPPVIFLWVYGEFVECSTKFSDYVFNQVFDWQHKLIFDDEGYAEDLKYNQIEYKSADAFERLSGTERLSTSRWVTDKGTFHACRFRSQDGARAVFHYGDHGKPIYVGGAKSYVEITATDNQLSDAFEAEILRQTSDEVIAPIFFCPHHPKSMLASLDQYIATNRRETIKHIAETRLSDELVDLVCETGRIAPFEPRFPERYREGGNPPAEEWIGGPVWGIRMKLVQIEHGWIRIESIEAA